MSNKKTLSVIKKIAKKTGNEYWLGELGRYEQNVVMDIIATRNIDDAVNDIMRDIL